MLSFLKKNKLVYSIFNSTGTGLFAKKGNEFVKDKKKIGKVEHEFVIVLQYMFVFEVINTSFLTVKNTLTVRMLFFTKKYTGTSPIHEP